MTGAGLVARYALFAALATLANLAVQRLALAIRADAAGYVVAIGAGTLAGLVLKYALDKRWIFFDQSAGIGAHGRRFTLYTVMGLATTAIFWGAETVAWIAWRTDFARETGAVLGLGVGYVVKYQLDRRFVFTSAHGQVA